MVTGGRPGRHRFYVSLDIPEEHGAHSSVYPRGGIGQRVGEAVNW